MSITDYAFKMNAQVETQSSIYGKHWSDSFFNGVTDAGMLSFSGGGLC
jgi:hypothetical protein